MFPHLREHFLLDPKVVYLNHGAYGAVSRVVMDEYQRWQEELERNSVEFMARKLPDYLNSARNHLAEYLNAPAKKLAFVSNATFGCNLVAAWAAQQGNQDVVALTHGYGAISRTWKMYAERGKIRYREIELPAKIESRDELIDHVFAELDEATSLLCLDHITCPTALVLPVKEICKEAREKNIKVLVDGAHAPGQCAVDLAEIEPDFYTGNCHKWMCAPKGSAFFYSKEIALLDIDPIVVSWGRAPKPEWPLPNHHEWLGTRDMSAFLSVPAAIRFQEELDWGEVIKACSERAYILKEELEEIFGTEPLATGPQWYGQMVAAEIPLEKKWENLSDRLFQKHKIEVPVTDIGKRLFLRVSLQGYNSEQDVEDLLEALREI